MKVEKTGDWSRERDESCYFLAGSFDRLECHGGYRYLLIAVNEITDRVLDELVTLTERGFHILIDSGIFWLTNEHKRAHGITMNEALALSPDEIDGFHDLWNRYLYVHEKLGDRAWGYIELDQGGAVNKRITRRKLQDLGINPIPVYHPLNDGWDYFDELAETNDRICLGNVVQADRYTRERLLTTMWERHRKYPDLWIHYLGFTPDAGFLGWPTDSSDSSTWLGGVRWGQVTDWSLLSRAGYTGDDFAYSRGTDADGPKGAHKAVSMAATSMHGMTMNWRHYMDALNDALGWTRYPPALDGEPVPAPKGTDQ